MLPLGVVCVQLVMFEKRNLVRKCSKPGAIFRFVPQWVVSFGLANKFEY